MGPEWRQICVPKESPHRSDGGYKSDKEGRDAQPTLVWGPLTEEGQGRGWRWSHRKLSHLPAYSWAFLQAEREHTLVRPQPQQPAQRESALPVLQVRLSTGESCRGDGPRDLHPAGTEGSTPGQEACIIGAVPPWPVAAGWLLPSHLALLS